MKQPWYLSKWAIISYHVILWAAFLFYPYFIRSGMAANAQPVRFPNVGGNAPFMLPPPGMHPGRHIIDKINLIMNFIYIGVFYFNSAILIPRLMYARKIGHYILVLTGLLAIIITIRMVLNHIYLPEFPMRGGLFGPNLFFSFPFFFIIAISIADRLIVDRIRDDRLQKEKENSNLKTELLFLRSQISPHFMFNVLNNMVALARKKSDELEPSLIKLSALMRYMLYEADAEKVPLQKEAEYLRSYIALQQQRFAGSVAVIADLQSHDGQHFLEPMLLIPFVENAFKHGTGMVTDPQINIALQIKDGKLLLEVRNKFNPQTNEVKDKTAGIGLTNVKRRLELLYGEKHHLIMRNDDNWFYVLLQLQLL